MAGLRMGFDGLDAAIKLLEVRRSRGPAPQRRSTGLPRSIRVRRVGGSPVVHSFQLGPCLPKHITGRAPRTRRRVQVSIAAISLLAVPAPADPA